MTQFTGALPALISGAIKSSSKDSAALVEKLIKLVSSSSASASAAAFAFAIAASASAAAAFAFAISSFPDVITIDNIENMRHTTIIFTRALVIVS
jgi:hypothetical protein